MSPAARRRRRPARGTFCRIPRPHKVAANPFVGFLGNYQVTLDGTLLNNTGDNAWSGPIFTAGTGASPNNYDIAGSTQLDLTGFISGNTLNKSDTGNLILEPTLNAGTIPADAYALISLNDGSTILSEDGANGNPTTGTTNNTNGASINGGVVTLEDSQGFEATNFTANATVASGASLHLVANVGHLDSVSGVSNELQIYIPVVIAGTGVNGEGALDSISGINTYEQNPNWVNSGGLPSDMISVAEGSSIGVLPDPVETPNNTYLTRDYSLTAIGLIGDANSGFIDDNWLTKVGGGNLILPTANTDFYGSWVIAQGWVTVENEYSLGGFQNGFGPNLAQGVYFNTTVESGAALMLLPAANNSNMTLQTNLILQGEGVTHSFSLINDMGAVENLAGVTTLSGLITLEGQVGIGAEQIFPGIVSDLITSNEIGQALPANLINASIPNAVVSTPIPATISIPNTLAAAGISQYTQVIDTGSSEGSIVINYSNFANDNLRVYYGALGTPGSSLIYPSTNLTGSGSTPVIAFGPGPSTEIEIVIDGGVVAPNADWSYSGSVTVDPTYFTGGIIKLGSQRLTLEGNGTYQGGVNVRQGVVEDLNNTGLGQPLNGSSAGLQFGTTVEAGAALVLSPSVADLNGGLSAGESIWANHLSLTGTGDTTFGYAPLTVLAGDNLWNGPITLTTAYTITYQGTLGNQAMPAKPISASFTNPATAVPTLTGDGAPTADVTQTTVGSAIPGVNDVETLTFSGVAGGVFTLTVWDGVTNFTTGSIAWSANTNALITAIQAALNLDPRLVNNFMVSLVSPIIDVAPNARLSVSGVIDDGTAIASPLIHNYVLSGPTASFNDTLGGPALVPSFGAPSTAPGTLSSTGYAFGNYPAQNQGLTLSNWVGAAPSSDANYTIQMDFDFTQIPPPNSTTYDQIINFINDPTDPDSDNGVLLQGDTVADTSLDAYNGGPNNGPPGLFSPNVPFDLIITRDAASGQVSGYVNGVAALSFDDSAAAQMIFSSPNNIATFFEDIDSVPDEVSGGNITALKIYNRTLTAGEIAVVAAGGTLTSATPLPADLTVAGGGELVLNGADTYRGTTYVNQGTLTVANSLALGATGSSAAQTITLTNPIAGNTYFKLAFNGATTAASIPYLGTSADAADIQAALTSLSTVGSLTLTGTTHGTISVTGLTSTASLSVGMPVSGAGIPADTTIASIVSGTSITLSQAATSSATGSLSFGLVSVDQGDPGEFLVNFYGAAAASGKVISPSIDTTHPAGIVSGTTIEADIFGGTEVANNAQLQMQGGITVANEALVIQGTGSNLEPTVQTYTIGGNTTGTYSLSFNGATASGISYASTAAQIQAALQTLATVGGAGGQVTVEETGISGGLTDQQQLSIDSTFADMSTFQLQFGPTATDPNIYTTPDITYDANSYLNTEVAISLALNSLPDIGLAGGDASVSGSFASGGGEIFTVTFIGALADVSGLPNIQVVAPANADITQSHLRYGALPTKTYQVVFLGSFAGLSEPTLTATTTGGTTITPPSLFIAGGSANATPDQWFSTSQASALDYTATSPSTAINNVQVYNGGNPTTENASGPVTDVVVDPTDPNMIYVATAGGGAWRTQDGGISWTPLFDSQFELANPAVMFGGQIAIDPNLDSNIYYATGIDANSSDSYYGSGVYESTNFGQTWTLLTDPVRGNPFVGMSISSIITNPEQDGSVVVAANYANVYGDVNGSQPPMTGGNEGVWIYQKGQWLPVLTNSPGITTNGAIGETLMGTTDGMDGVITGIDTTNLSVGEMVLDPTGMAGIPAGTTIMSVDSATQVTLSATPTGMAGTYSLQFTGTTLVTGITTTGLAVGMTVTGPAAAGLAPGTTIASIGMNQITLSAAATPTTPGAFPLTFKVSSLANFADDNFTSLVYDPSSSGDADAGSLIVGVSSASADFGIYESTPGTDFFNTGMGNTGPWIFGQSNAFNTNTIYPFNPTITTPLLTSLSGSIMLADNTYVASGVQDTGFPNSSYDSYYAGVFSVGSLWQVQWLQLAAPVPVPPGQVTQWADIADANPVGLNNIPNYLGVPANTPTP